MISFIKIAWKGEAKLWKVFWIMGILLGIASFVYILVLTPVLFISPFLYIGLYLLWVFIVNGYQYIALWRCAFNCGWKGWGYIVRVLVVLGVIGMVFTVFTTVTGTLAMNSLGSAMQEFEQEMQNMEMEMQQGGFGQEGGFAPGAFDPNAFDPDQAGAEAGEFDLDEFNAEMDKAQQELERIQQMMGEGVSEEAANQLDAMGADATVESAVQPVLEAPLDGAVESPAATDPGRELIAMCTKKFDDSYKAQGFDPTQYPTQRNSYIELCVNQLISTSTGGAAQ